MNYYNENDPKAAEWLRELIRQGIIPNGIVDTRSICDVRASDLAGFTQCHFFAGISGWSLALQLAGWPSDRPVWTGSCPCQPFSASGKGKGADDERHLWPVFRDLIRECRPEHVFGEQVANAVGHGWLDGVSTDLEAEGYAVGAVVLGAHSVGAPHIRQRLYWVANAGRERYEPRGVTGIVAGAGGNTEGETRERQWSGDADCDCGSTDGMANAESEGPSHGGTRAIQPFAGEFGGESYEQCGRGLRAESAGFWSDFRIVHCLDGKARRIQACIEPSFLLLANGFYYRMASVRTEFISHAINQIRSYAETSRTDPAKTMFMVQNSIREEALQWAIGGQGELHSPEVLLPFLRDILSALNRSADYCGGQKASTQESDVVLRDMRIAVESQCASYRRESIEQYGGEPSNALRVLSWFLARCGQACGYSTRREDAVTFPLSGKVAGRVGLLRGYGNAIVPQVAAEFIKAFKVGND